jgi:hypothetical protein
VGLSCSLVGVTVPTDDEYDEDCDEDCLNPRPVVTLLLG